MSDHPVARERRALRHRKSVQRRKIPAYGFGSKYVVFGGMTSPRSATSVSWSRVGGRRANNAPPSSSQARVSSPRGERAEVISSAGRAGVAEERLEDVLVEDGDAQAPRSGGAFAGEGGVVPAAGDVQREAAGRLGGVGDLADLEGFGQLREQGVGVDRAGDTAVEGQQAEAVGRVDDAHQSGTRGPVRVAPHAQAGGDAVVAVGDVVHSSAELVGQRLRGRVGHSPDGLLPAVGSGEADHRVAAAALGDRVLDAWCRWGAAVRPARSSRPRRRSSRPGRRPAAAALLRGRAPARRRTPRR